MDADTPVGSHAYASLRPRPAHLPIPLTSLQRCVWTYLVAHGLPSVRLCAISQRLVGPLDSHLLEKCLERVIQRHESLRTRILLVKGSLEQKIAPPVEYRLDQVDLSGITLSQRATEVTRLTQVLVADTVDPAVGPMLSAILLKLSPSEHMFIVMLDHLISDAVSYEILKMEIWNLYRQTLTTGAMPMVELPIQFGDYAAWQRQEHANWLRQHGHYWHNRLIGAPFVFYGWEQDTSETGNTLGAMLHVPFAKGLSEALRKLARQESIPLPILALSIHTAALSRLLERKDFVIGFLIHGRDNQPELQDMIGYLAYPLYLRIEFNEKDTCLDLLKRVSLEYFTAFRHRDFGRMPAFMPGGASATLMFNWLSTRWTFQLAGSQRNIGELKIQPFRLKWNIVPLFSPFFSDSPAGVAATIYFRTDVFSTDTVKHFANSLRTIAGRFVASPHDFI